MSELHGRNGVKESNARDRCNLPTKEGWHSVKVRVDELQTEIPKWAKWIALTYFGDLVCYRVKPWIGTWKYESRSASQVLCQYGIVPVMRYGFVDNWKQSLIKVKDL